MKVLFDQNVPHGLREMLPGHAVATADEQGWSELTNGELLRVAEADGFEVMVSADQNLGYQQNLKDRRLAIVVLNTNQWRKIQAASEQVAAAIHKAVPGSLSSSTEKSPVLGV